MLHFWPIPAKVSAVFDVLPQHLLDVRGMTKEQAEECEIPVGQIVPV
jgi:hypothetical protein